MISTPFGITDLKDIRCAQRHPRLLRVPHKKSIQGAALTTIKRIPQIFNETTEITEKKVKVQYQIYPSKQVKN